MAFRGWPAEALHFYEGLEADNSKAYWQDNKDTYDTCCRAPMDELLAELAPEFGAAKLFRPYRDVRFSADKTPYKTSIAASLAGGGYVHLSADGLVVGSGMYHLAADQLERYRAAVAVGDDGGVGVAGAVGERDHAAEPVVGVVAVHGSAISADAQADQRTGGFPGERDPRAHSISGSQIRPVASRLYQNHERDGHQDKDWHCRADNNSGIRNGLILFSTGN